MFENLTDDDARGQVGIGTLIVFIAMVLVAAIAAGVLINTAGVLQSQASNTGSETQEEVANQIDVVHAVGMTDGADNVTSLNLTIKKSAGSNAIDMTSATVQYTSNNEDIALTFNESANASVDGGLTDANETKFGTKSLTSNNDGESLIETSERMEIHIDTKAIESGNGLPSGSEATIKIIDQSGAQYTYGVSVPSTFGDKSVVEV
ncbi:flagellin [Haloterrigena turkmenica DSM 5511]|uniref:Flagellin n=1 Tax=Haloterrigena turkmenica (strain ATCC 51198 / DSM 5511 / JCM 9101 / NCIMB 13204 / VKM B-1734 / 4k) TaxID=543526 RepID=D2RQA5_HALTV|nr:archaellin/type IV pilin N-terminal domain-containing protein [Haloterrigena turkmenica]ADB62282.1 flagellin [Haloterrigena turkmenica DSM 5511]